MSGPVRRLLLGVLVAASSLADVPPSSLCRDAQAGAPCVTEGKQTGTCVTEKWRRQSGIVDYLVCRASPAVEKRASLSIPPLAYILLAWALCLLVAVFVVCPRWRKGP